MKIDYVIVQKEENLFTSFPSVVSLDGNKVLVAFREAGEKSVNAAKKNTPSHHDNDSRICVLASEADGQSFLSAKKKIVLIAQHGFNDPALTKLKDGTILLRSIEIQVETTQDRNKLASTLLAHRPDLGTVSGNLGLTLQRSYDKGESWSQPEIISVDGDFEWFSRDAISELEDGTWVLPVYKSSGFNAEKAYVIRSFDKGKTWGDVALLAEDKNGTRSMFRGVNYNEVCVLNLGMGRLMAMIRSDSSYQSESDQYMAIGGTGELTQAFSENAGLSWTYPEHTGIFGQPANIIKLKNGKILCTYGYRKSPFAVKACLSNDEGKTWDTLNTITIKESCPFWDMGYPMSVQREDGKIVTVYYWNDENKTRYVEMAIWDNNLIQ
jgi:sialidase-1